MGVAESATYRGCTLIIDNADILVVAPDGDLACFYSMAKVRCWVRRKRRQLGLA